MTLVEMSDGRKTIIRVRPDKVELMQSKGWAVVAEPAEVPAPPADDDAPVALEEE